MLRMVCQPEVWKKVIQFVARHWLPCGDLRECFAVTMIRQLSKHVLKPRERFYAIGLCTTDQRVEDRCMMAATDAANEKVILPPNRRVFTSLSAALFSIDR